MFKLDILKAAEIVRWGTVFGSVVAAVFLGVLAALARYTDYMRAETGRFLLELFVISVVTAVPIFYVAYTRRSSYRRAARDFVLLTLTGAALWLLFELAGVNTVLFPPKARAHSLFDLSHSAVEPAELRALASAAAPW